MISFRKIVLLSIAVCLSIWFSYRFQFMTLPFGIVLVITILASVWFLDKIAQVFKEEVEEYHEISLDREPINKKNCKVVKFKR